MSHENSSLLVSHFQVDTTLKYHFFYQKKLPRNLQAKVEKIDLLQFTPPWSSTFFHSLFENFENFFIAIALDQKEERVVAFSVFRLYDEGEAELLKILVDPSFRMRGVAKSLLEQSIEFLKGGNVDFLSLDVSVNNGAALHLYRQLGFAFVRIEKSFYQNGDDAQHLQLSF